MGIMMGDEDQGRASLSRTKLMERAVQLVDLVRSYTDEAERQRRLSSDVVKAMRDAGLHRILQPQRHGGAAAHFSGMVEIVETISAGCSAAGWCLTQYCSHNCLLGYWPGEGQDDVWSQTPDAIVAGSLIPSGGSAQKVDGGWEINGQWPFASGVYAADWFIATAFVSDDDGSSTAQMHVVPATDIQIIDTWHTAGLRGTGSADVSVVNCFVPHHRALRMIDMKGGGNAPGCIANKDLLYRVPAAAMFSINQSAVALGLAQGTYNTYIANARDRVARMSGRNVSDYATVQVKVAEALTAIEMARLLLHNCCDLGMEIATEKKESSSIPMQLKTGLRAKATMAGKLSAEALDLLFQVSGGAGVYDRNPISQAMRDMNCIRGHITQNWDINASNHGRVLLGLPSSDPIL